METTEHGETRTATRRRVLQALGLGGAFAALPVGIDVVGAQPDQTTTTAPPKAPTDNDIGILGLAQMAELATVELYNAILSDYDDPTWVPTLEVFREHHEAYADAISAMLGRQAPNMPSQKLLDAFGEAAGEPPLATLAQVEHTLSSTHTSLLGAIEATDAAALIASIVPSEARKAAVLAVAGGAGLADLIPASGLDELEAALAPEDLIEA